jgi:hypothetical protein
MSEFHSIPQKPLTLETRVPKTYNKAKHLRDGTQKRINETIEGSYHTLKDYVKQLYATLPNESDRIIVEMDRTLEPATVMSMYSFLTRHFYFYIECSIMLQYRVEFQFDQCPFEKEITKALQETILRSYSTEVMKMPNYPDFFEEVLRVQPDKFKQVV